MWHTVYRIVTHGGGKELSFLTWKALHEANSYSSPLCACHSKDLYHHQGCQCCQSSKLTLTRAPLPRWWWWWWRWRGHDKWLDMRKREGGLLQNVDFFFFFISLLEFISLELRHCFLRIPPWFLWTLRTWNLHISFSGRAKKSDLLCHYHMRKQAVWGVRRGMQTNTFSAMIPSFGD